ncbi:MAG: DinB family protein [Cyclobacteriaceae bacterium]|nr:DinB family protein [Cyclobacteriaceae bacterium]
MNTVAKENLLQLKNLLQQIGRDHFTEKSTILSGSTIGQHVRHILEFYLLLVSGSFSGTISYDKRERDLRIETDPEFAAHTVDRLLARIDTLENGLQVKFEGDYSKSGGAQNVIFSSVGRELAYCIEHSIHHQAIIRAALISMGLEHLTTRHFGVAYSTIRYRNGQCAQ